MEDNAITRSDRSEVRMSNSPRRSPRIVAGLTSPVMSVHPSTYAMDSIHSQPDFGLRTIDFFDDSSEEGSLHELSPDKLAPDAELFQPTLSSAKRRQKNNPQEDQFVSRCEERRSVPVAEDDGYQPLSPIPIETQAEFVDTPSSSFNGSVDELLPGALRSSPPQVPRPAYLSSGRKKRPSSGIEQPSPLSSKNATRLLGAHAVAHEITLQALMRDEEALDRSLQTFAPVGPGNRNSILNLPPSMVAHDPRSPRTRTFSTPASKKVHVLPPPIDTSAARHSLPSNMIRTPYPFVVEKPRHSIGTGGLEPFGTPGMRSISVGTGTPHLQFESILTLSVRRCNTNSRSRVTTLIVPASHDYSAMRANIIGEKERQFKAIDFDDAELFRQLKAAYKQMTGFSVHLSARSLTRIAVCGPASQAADASYGWLHSPRSPRTQTSPWKSLTNTFSEEKILLHYKNPNQGKSRYAYVRWAHRLAAAQDDEDAQTPSTLVRGERQNEGLEFVVGWSVRRILAALLLIICLSVAATLLWTFLGRPSTPNSTETPSAGGFRDAGERVGTGVVMGICVLLVGLSGFFGWIGISWIVL